MTLQSGILLAQAGEFCCSRVNIFIMTTDFFIGMAVGSFLGALITLIITSLCVQKSNDYGNRRQSNWYGDNWGSWGGWYNGNADNYHGEEQSDDRTPVTLLPESTATALREAGDTQREIQEKGLYVWVWSKKQYMWVMRPVELSVGGYERFHLFSWSDTRSEFISRQATNDFMKLEGAKEYLEQLDDQALANELCNYVVNLEMQEPKEEPHDDEPLKHELADDIEHEQPRRVELVPAPAAKERARAERRPAPADRAEYHRAQANKQRKVYPGNRQQGAPTDFDYL